MRLLDLFCGAGGAAAGYYRAGIHEIVGIDLRPQPHYPYDFVQADALDYLAANWRAFDIIHASPPCQAHSSMKFLNSHKHKDLIPQTRQALKETGLPYIIENVPGAPLINPITLCGTMFGIRVIRHRLFETNPIIYFPPAPCAHVGKATGIPRKGQPVKTLKDYAYVTVVGNGFKPEDAKAAMEINWMTKREIAQAIPPAYTKWIGSTLCQQL